jgi:HEPN domain-containing protein
MRDLKEAQQLLRAAERDLRGLMGMLQLEAMFDDELFGQHVQQAVEKLAKAWITALGQDFPYTHDLDRLLQQLEDLGCDVSDYWNLVAFTDFALSFRYEGLLADSQPIDRKATTSQVQSFYNHVESVVQSSKVKGAEDV